MLLRIHQMNFHSYFFPKGAKGPKEDSGLFSDGANDTCLPRTDRPSAFMPDFSEPAMDATLKVPVPLPRAWLPPDKFPFHASHRSTAILGRMGHHFRYKGRDAFRVQNHRGRFRKRLLPSFPPHDHTSQTGTIRKPLPGYRAQTTIRSQASRLRKAMAKDAPAVRVLQS